MNEPTVQTEPTAEATVQALDTPDGAFTLIADPQGRVLASGWSSDVATVLARIPLRVRPTRLIEGETDAAAAVRAYYDGDLLAIDTVPVAQYGTELQLRGWKALRTIPLGGPLTYTGLAAALGEPRAVRAAASICARNAPALFVPCHRVLRTDGSLGGFAWGLDVKRALLERESH
ncbi:methylated-DNA-[protein]-cysteine S-methyltransferase [Microbacterium halimionae]|uniref:Methylated-DNA-[protein]-cysteine S-methyltransferase n=1 Tax=Microbacterium halimionae TaxID=1526413 RepID=A0A7W3PN09_9MICO|nr:methylated-DNA--[protein]-cysteine S-methyltransferase [Microbacterium halimionae]MBA8817527.1 methylated-DNA-[protein]-cysteine S-methyltransferase [Microbacterium halimionae]NII95030.1 methylated-DNA-[protein]-cysteine S-methyltransferase [Microbacterium halimionae]